MGLKIDAETGASYRLSAYLSQEQLGIEFGFLPDPSVKPLAQSAFRR